jgi:hypothetical protein
MLAFGILAISLAVYPNFAAGNAVSDVSEINALLFNVVVIALVLNDHYRNTFALTVDLMIPVEF